jgi:acyl-CoA synthetase (AMP-forming)/AMP-acid ligase II
LRERSHDFGADDIVVAEDGRVTYAEAEEQSCQLAAAFLRAGVGKAMRVGILYPNGSRWLIHWLACVRIGAIAVPINSFLKPPELRSVIQHADIHLLLVASAPHDERYVERLESALPSLTDASTTALELLEAPYLRSVWVSDPIDRPWAEYELARSPEVVDAQFVAHAEEQVSPSDAAVIVYTSGTTAAPKGVIQTHGALVRHAANVSAVQLLTPDDRFYSVAPFFWIGGLVVNLLSVMHAGATLITQHRFDAASCLDLLEKERATVVRVYPNVRRQLEEHPRFTNVDLSAVWAGLDWPRPAPDRMMRTHGALGMTETCGPHIYSARWTAPWPDKFPGSHGPPIPGMEHRIIDEHGVEVPDGVIGEILVRGYALMAGLHRCEREDVFETDGWYRTGDLGHRADGVIYFAGRLKNVIKSAGSNVAPEEIELALRRHPGIEEAIVVGVPAGDRGEDVAAAIVVSPSGGPDLAQLAAALRAELASYKVPRHIVVVQSEEIPRSNSGEKIDLEAVRRLIVSRRR